MPGPAVGANDRAQLVDARVLRMKVCGTYAFFTGPWATPPSNFCITSYLGVSYRLPLGASARHTCGERFAREGWDPDDTK